MLMPSPVKEEAAYWHARREQLLAQLAESEKVLFDRLKAIYDKEAAKLEKEIAAYYQKYGKKSVIEYRTLLASLSDDDRRLLMERMEDFAKKYPQHAHLLPVRESIYRLNELEAIQTAIRIQQLEIGALEIDEIREHFEEYARLAANLAAEELGFGSDFYTLNSQVVQETVGEAWSHGESYSERIWDNREKLAAYLNDDFAKLIARGASYQQCSNALSERFVNVSSRDMMRLVYTEGTFLFNEAQARVHSDDFEFYRLSCVMDGRACEICRGVQAEQGKNPARFSERSPGVNFPPLHPWCRCGYEVVVEDWDAWIEDYVLRHGG